MIDNEEDEEYDSYYDYNYEYSEYDTEPYFDIEPFCPCADCRNPHFRDEIKMLEINFLYGDYEDKLEFSVPHTNLEDKVNRIHPELGCSYCPPNKSENAGRTGEYSNYYRRRPKKAKITKSRNSARKFKKKQKEYEFE